MWVWIIVAVVVFILIIMMVSIYNRLVRAKNQYANAFAQIDVQLKRRYDLIPNLVETAKGYAKHEKETLDAVVKARDTAMSALESVSGNIGDPSAMQALGDAESGLLGALGKLNVVVEAYPDLKANTSMEQLMEELSSTENKVAFSRQAYNDAIMSFNIARASFPAVMFAGMFGFTEVGQLDIRFEAGGREAPKVEF